MKIIEVIDDKTLCLLKYDKNFEDPEEKSYFSFDFVFDESVEQVFLQLYDDIYQYNSKISIKQVQNPC